MTTVGATDTVALVLIAVIGFVVILGVGGLFLLALLASRGDPDPTGRRPFGVYLFGVAFITLWTALLGSAITVFSLVGLIGKHTGRTILRYSCGPGISDGRANYGSGLGRCSPQFAIHPIGDAAARGAVVGGLLLLVSASVFYFHLRRGLALAGGDPEGPAVRVVRTYVSAVSLLSVLVGIVAVVIAVYAVFAVAGPGVFGASGRLPALRDLLDALYVALAVGFILAAHLRLDLPRLWPWRQAVPHGWPTPPASGWGDRAGPAEGPGPGSPGASPGAW